MIHEAIGSPDEEIVRSKVHARVAAAEPACHKCRGSVSILLLLLSKHVEGGKLSVRVVCNSLQLLEHMYAKVLRNHHPVAISSDIQ